MQKIKIPSHHETRRLLKTSSKTHYFTLQRSDSSGMIQTSTAKCLYLKNIRNDVYNREAIACPRNLKKEEEEDGWYFQWRPTHSICKRTFDVSLNRFERTSPNFMVFQYFTNRVKWYLFVQKFQTRSINIRYMY